VSAGLERPEWGRLVTHFGVNGTTLALIPTMLTLRRRPTFLLHLEEWAVGVRTTRDAMTFDARRARELLVVDENHDGDVEKVPCRKGEGVGSGGPGNGFRVALRARETAIESQGQDWPL
jgi:hypothetical protein